MEELTDFLREFDKWVTSGNPDSEALGINSFDFPFRYPGLLHNPEAAHSVFQHYCEVGKQLTPERLGLFKKVFADTLKLFLSLDYTDCPFYNQQQEEGITLPYASWEEEVNAIVGDGGYDEVRRIEEIYFDRCLKCRKSLMGCPHRIIQPIVNGPYCRQSEYEQWNNPAAPAEKKSQKETRQQKAAKTRKGDAKREISPLLRPLCKKLVADNLAELAEDGVNYKFLGNNALYCYLAKRVSEERNLKCISWQAFLGFLKANSKEAVLRKTASRLPKDLKGASKIDSLINETLSEIKSPKR